MRAASAAWGAKQTAKFWVPSEIAAVKADLVMDARQTAALEKMGQTLFIRLGSLMTVLIGLLAVISRIPH